MSTNPRVSSAIPGEPAHFASVLAHQPVLASRFGEVYGTFWTSDVLSARVKELCRMRNARITQCGFCRQVRFDKPLRDGLDETAIADVTDDYAQSSVLSTAEKAALRFTDALIHDPALLDREARDELHQHFTPPQIAELGIGIALFLALAKVLITLGLEPDAMDTTVLPTPRIGGGGAPPPPRQAHEDTPLDRALAHNPDLAKRFRAFHDAPRADALLDPAIHELVNRRIAQIHENASEPANADDPRAKAVLPFVDKLPFAHHAISDDEAGAAREALGDAGFVALAVHAALCDAQYRLRLVMERVLAPADAAPAG